jgi:hypothetical protein
MQSIPRSLLFTILLAGLALVGCSKETPPEPTPAPTSTPPPVTATGNKDCAAEGTGNGTCKLSTEQVAAESGMPGHGCNGFVDETAIHIAKGDLKPGKFKKIHIKKEKTSPNDFTIAVEACPGSKGNPFPHANKPDKDNWDSGDLDPTVADDSHFHLIMTEKTAKGTKKSDPHIVVDGTGKNR